MKILVKCALALCCLSFAGAAWSWSRSDDAWLPAASPNGPGTVSVLTYNVHGAPWPITFGRSAKLREIADRLQRLRAEGRAPSVVVLQEAFSGDAQVIRKTAGYAYTAVGAGKHEAGTGTMTPFDQVFADGARWWKGETEGKFVGSGLQILSDYPILAVHRMAFPAFACAGWDCLANKGALMVTLAVPGGPPVDVVTTHLNSRHASAVPDARSNYAYGRQVEMLTAFIREKHDDAHPLIVAGDFNVGPVPPRREALLTNVQSWAGDETIRDAMHQYRRDGGLMSPAAAFSFHRARDWQFYAAGTTRRIGLLGIEVPFGFEPSGGMLSDHVGYVARYRLDTPTATALATTNGRAKA